MCMLLERNLSERGVDVSWPLWLSMKVISFKPRVLVRIGYYKEYKAWLITDNQRVIASMSIMLLISINDDVTVFKPHLH